MMSRSTYQHSNNIGLGFIVLPIGGLFIAAIMVILYVFSLRHLFGSVSIVLPVVGGTVLGVTIHKLASFSLCRDRRFVLLISVLLTVVSFYSISALFCYEHRSLVEGGTELSAWQFHHPFRLADAAYDIAEGGEYQRGRFAFVGWRMWLDWGIEGLVFIGVGTIIPILGVNSRLFCESSRSWMDYQDDDISFEPPLSDEVRAQIAAGDLDSLLSLPRVSSLSPHRLSLAIWSAQKVGGECYYQVYEVVPDPKDRVEGERIEKITATYRLTTDEYIRLREDA